MVPFLDVATARGVRRVTWDIVARIALCDTDGTTYTGFRPDVPNPGPAWATAAIVAE